MHCTFLLAISYYYYCIVCTYLYYYSEKVFLSSDGTHAVVKNSDEFYIVGDVVASPVPFPPANETHFSENRQTNDL